MTKIADLMTPGPMPIDLQQSIAEAMHRMEMLSFRHLPVIDGDRVLGVVSEARILRYLTEHGSTAGQQALVGAAMGDAFVVTPDAPVMAVARAMVERGLDAAVVMDQGRIRGIFTATDALRALAEREPPEGRPAAVSPWPRAILCAVDFSPGSREAADVALELARKSGATLTLYHAFDLPVAAVDAADVGAAALGPIERETDASLRELYEALDHPGGPPIHVAHGLGAPAETIVRHAQDHRFDMIVVGTHGRTGLSRVLVGSVAESVMRHAPCPVLVVRQHSRD